MSKEKGALERAQTIGEDAAKLGFDWPDEQGAIVKLKEEFEEWLWEWEQGESREAFVEEFGDVLFSFCMVARKFGIDTHAALMGTCDKFERRFHFVTQGLKAQGMAPEEATLEQMDRLWDEAKSGERALKKEG